MSALARGALAGTDLVVSELCLGTANFGGFTDAAESTRIVDAFISAGGNFIDTANVYSDGVAEEIIGAAILGRRDQVVIVTKTGMASASAAQTRGGSRAAIVASIEASLRRLRTDYIDLYLMHVPDPATPQEETLMTLDALKRQGKLRHAGVSNYSGWQLAKANAIAARNSISGVVALQAQYSLVSRDIEMELLPLCREDRIPILAYAPLGGGFLSGKYESRQDPPQGTRLADQPANAHPMSERTLPVIEALRNLSVETGYSAAQIAMRWVASRPMVTSLVVGARSLDQLQQNLGMSACSLDEAQLRSLEQISRPRLPYPQALQQMLGCRTSAATL